MLVHPTKPGQSRTLWDQAKELLAPELSGGGSLAIINRLDRETSGLVLVTTDPKRAAEFSRAMQLRDLEKGYRALVLGWPEWDEREISAPLIRQGIVAESAVWLKRCVHEKGAEAVTALRVEKRFEACGFGEVRKLALVAAKPCTGRTHQIRVHLAHLGYPVLGDKLYVDEKNYLEFIETGWTEALARRLWMPRQALHSAMLSLPQRLGGGSWELALPADFVRVIDGCGEVPFNKT